LQGVKDIEWRAVLDCEALGLGMIVPRVGPEILRGIEINPLAAELARTTIWIGDIQWRVKNAIHHHPSPLLRKLDSIECRDALLAPDGKGGFKRAEWPDADFIIGNPPLLGGKLVRSGLGDETVEALFKIYEGRVPAEADLVCYWFAKAWEALQADRTKRIGLVATNSIRGGANRKVLEPIAEAGSIFEAWSDQPWTVEGAAVRVSLVCFARQRQALTFLDGSTVNIIPAHLADNLLSTTNAFPLKENRGFSFQGPVLVGAFDIPQKLALSWLVAPLNANGRPNSDVLRPLRNGMDINSRPREKWVIDFARRSLSESCLFEAPFRHVEETIRPLREKSADRSRRERWWLHGRTGDEFRSAIAPLVRYIAGSQVSKHRIWVWLDVAVQPHQTVIAIALDDYSAFGVVHSRFHETWALRLGTSLEDRPRYTPTTTFETFPFPEGLTPNFPAADYASDMRAQRIAAAARRLDELRNNWLNPPDLIHVVPEVTPTAAPGEAPRRYPDRILPKTAEAAVKLKQRTLTNLYNQRPRWLADAHDELDRAVAAAYGWPEDISTEDALARLLALNLERTRAQ
jgi:type II restriction/modification system DNA methylase subunit YeeA